MRMKTTNRELIKRRIKELGFTYIEIATKAEISVYTLRRIVSSDYGFPKAFTRSRLAKALELPVEAIFTIVENSKAS